MPRGDRERGREYDRREHERERERREERGGGQKRQRDDDRRDDRRDYSRQRETQGADARGERARDLDRPREADRARDAERGRDLDRPRDADRPRDDRSNGSSGARPAASRPAGGLSKGIFAYLSEAASAASKPAEETRRTAASGGSAAQRMQAELAAFQQQQKEEEEEIPEQEQQQQQEQHDASTAEPGELPEDSSVAESDGMAGEREPDGSGDGASVERDLRARLLKSRAEQNPRSGATGSDSGAVGESSAASAGASAAAGAGTEPPTGGLAKSRWLEEDSEDEDRSPGQSPAEPVGSSAAASAAVGGYSGGDGGESRGDPSDAVEVDAAAEGASETQPATVPGTPPSRPAADGSAGLDSEPPGSVPRGVPPAARATAKLGAPPSLLQRRCRSVDDFEKLSKIGEGTFGDVYKARDRRSNDIVALKQVKMTHEGQEGFPQTALREINILLALKHTHVINAREMVVGDTYDKIFMVMDFMDHDLKQLMAAMKQPFTEAEVKRLMLDLTSALEYCHDRWVFHRDMKTSNLLMNNKGEVSICDFGLARYYHEPPQGYSPTVVTLWYRAPEVLLADGGKGVKTTYGPAIDVWSLGCIFAELVLNAPLMAGQGEIDQVKRIFELLGTPDEQTWPGCNELHYLKRVKLRPQPFNRLKDKFRRTSFTSATALSEAGVDLLSQMLLLNPEKRISAKDALRHRYFSEEPAPKPHVLMPTFPSTHKQPPRRK